MLEQAQYAEIMRSKLTPKCIPTGLTLLDRQALSVLLAVFEDSKAISLISDKVLTFADGAVNKYTAWKDGLVQETEERFTARIHRTAQSIQDSQHPDDFLRLCLWAHVRDALSLPPRIATSPRELKNAANDIGGEIGRAVARQRKAEERKRLSKKSWVYWRRFGNGLNPFAQKSQSPVAFDEAVREAVLGLFDVAFGEDGVSKSEKKKIIDEVRSGLSEIDQRILNEAGVSDLTDDTITKLLTTGGGLIGLMGAVEAAGFGAYILAAQASAIIPLVGGKTLVSLLFVISHPLFVLPVLFTAGVFAADDLTKTIRRAFAITTSSLLALRGVVGAYDDEVGAAQLLASAELALRVNTKDYEHLQLKNDVNYGELAVILTNGINFPKAPDLSLEAHRALEAPYDLGKNKQLIEAFLFPARDEKSDALALGGLVFGDFLFDLSAIDPLVLEAADFSHKADLSTPFDFAAFADRISDLPAASLRGHENNLMGYTAERVVAARLTENGHVVSIPDSASQPGFDLLVDGKEFQVKCVTPENLGILEQHFLKYPDTPVIVNSEVADTIAERTPEWAGQVFFIDGYTYEFARGLVAKATRAGDELDDYELVPFIAAVSAVRNTHGWWKGEQSLGDTAFNVAIDSASKGALGLAGGFLGKGLGMLVFGPAGAYVFGGVLAVAATIESRWITDHIDKNLDPDLDQKFSAGADALLLTCIKSLEAKALGIDSKVASLPKGEFSEAMRYRWQWEEVYVRSKINEAEHLIKFGPASGERKAVSALKFAAESGIHPIWLQADYEALLGTLAAPKERWRKVKELIRNLKSQLFFRGT